MKWLVKLICCAHDDGSYETDSWEDADNFRESYLSGIGVNNDPNQSGHKRAAIIYKAEEVNLDTD